MKVEVRLACGVLIGEIEVPSNLMEKSQAVRFPVPMRGGFGDFTLTIAEWVDRYHGTKTRIFKATLDDVACLRSINGFKEDERFNFYRIEDLLVREKLVTKEQIEDADD